MTVDDIEQFMQDHPNEFLSIGAGWIHPQAAFDLLKEGPLEVIDTFSKRRQIPIRRMIDDTRI